MNFDRLPRSAAIALLIGLALLIVFGATGGGSGLGGPARQGTDAQLYAAISSRVAGGESYYDAALVEQRARNYPVRPFYTVREPTLAWFRAALGLPGVRLALRLLAVAAIFAFALRLRGEAAHRLAWGAATALAAATALTMSLPGLEVWHEIWAGLLILLSLGLRSPRSWLASVAVGLLAVLVRELALPYLLVMLAFAAVEKRRREAIGWALAIVVAVVALVAHRHAVMLGIQPGDPVSAGWGGLGGWRSLISMIHRSTFLSAFPLIVTAVAVPLSFLGWSSLTGALGRRALLLTGGYAMTFMIVARPDNFYWAALIAAVLLPGLSFAPAALAKLVAAASGRERAGLDRFRS